MVKVKVCGLTNLEDLRLVEELGSDFAGFVFHRPSPRFVEPRLVKDLIGQSSRKTAHVGVFVNERIDTVRRIYAECRLDIVQLHGDESPEYGAALGLPFWKALRIRDISSLGELERYGPGVFLLEAFVPGAYGGTGHSLDQEIVRRAVAAGATIVLAGGISTENLAAAVALRPWAVDLSSSLEEYPGKKSAEKVRCFFSAWRKAFHLPPPACRMGDLAPIDKRPGSGGSKRWSGIP
jgi:phosphoribosylanthranilate isomerase